MTIDEACSLLKVSADAHHDAVVAAYRKMAFDYHPDRVALLPEEFQQLATEKLKAINAAFEILCGKRPAATNPSQGEGDAKSAGSRNVHRDVARIIDTESRAVLSKLAGVYYGGLYREVTKEDSLHNFDKIFAWPNVPQNKLIASRKLTPRTYGQDDLLLVDLESSFFWVAGFCVTADGLLHWKNEMEPQKSMRLSDICRLNQEKPSIFNFQTWKIHINDSAHLDLEDTRDEILIEIIMNVLSGLSAYFRGEH